MDSASDLISRLDLAENFTSPRQKEEMDNMEIDLDEEEVAPSFNPRSRLRRKNHSHRWRDSGPRLFSGGNVTRNDAEQQRRRARLVRLISDTLETRSSSQKQDEVLQCEENGVCNELTVSREPFENKSPYHHRTDSWREKEKGQVPAFDGGETVLKDRDTREKREGIVLSDDSFPQSGSWRNQGRRRWAHNGYISPCNSAKHRFSTEADGQDTGGLVDGATRSSPIKRADSPCVWQPKTGKGHQRWSLPKATGSGRLLQNDCLSNCEMSQDKNAANNDGLGAKVQGELDENSSHQHIGRPDSEHRHSDKKKGKMIMEDIILSGGQDRKAEFHSDRLCSIEETEVAGTAKDDYAFRSSEDIPWRGDDFTSKAHAVPLEQSACVSKREQGTSGHLSNLRHKIPMEYEEYVHDVSDSPEIKDSRLSNPKAVLAPKESDYEIRGNRRPRKFMKGKRKCNFTCSNYSGTSSSTFENLETFDHESTRHNPHIRPTMTSDSQHHYDIYDPVELDELQLPELRHNNLQELCARVPDHSRASASQVESDEILARQLQEQFYEEVAGSAGTEEMDATLAWSLQQEDAQQAASAARRFQSDNREASMAHLYAYYAELPYRNSSARWSDRAQSQTSNRKRNNYRSEIDLETRLVAEARNFTGMDLQRRRNFLEELEAAFDHSNDALGSHHDFNENDYETMLALDENIHQHGGASESQINSLPQSVIQSDTVEEACAVCLENPTTGDAIRHLPCLHKFHKECIDTWLRRRTWCPVCKSEIA